MHALVYTGTEKIVYREEKDPIKKPGESISESSCIWNMWI